MACPALQDFSTLSHKRNDFRNKNIIYLLTYLLTPWCRVLLEKLTGLQLVKKFPAFHGTRKFITALTSFRHLSVSWTSPVHIPTSLLLEIHPNIIHPSTPWSPQCFLPSGFPTKTLYTPSPHPYAPHAHPISFFSILSPAQYWVSRTDHLAPRYAIHSISIHNSLCGELFIW